MRQMFTAPMKLTLAAVAITLIGMGFYLIDWRPRLAELAQLEQLYRQRQQELEAARQAVQALPQLTRQLEQLEADLAGLKSSPVSEDSQVFVANYVADIERLVSSERMASGDESFSIVSITPGAVETKGSEGVIGLPTRVFQMQMTGRFATVTDFLEQLGLMKLDRLVTINKVSLTPQSGEKGQSPVLSVTIPITAYLRQGSAPRG